MINKNPNYPLRDQVDLFLNFPTCLVAVQLNVMLSNFQLILMVVGMQK